MSFKTHLFILFAFSAGTISQAQAQSPTSAAGKFNVFIKGDAVFSSSETEGPVAIGGNLTTNQYQISFNKQHGVFFVNNASIGLAVRGGIKLNNGSLTINSDNYLKIGQCSPSSSAASDLKVWYRDNNDAASTIRITGTDENYWDTPNITINANVNTWSPSVSETVNPVCENIFGTGANQIDIDGAFAEMIKRSEQLAGLVDNLPIRDQNGNIMSSAAVGPYLNTSVIGNNPKIIVDPNKLNVLTVSAAVWNSIQNSNIEMIPAGPSLGQTNYSGNFGLIINIVNFESFAAGNGNTKINFPGFGGLNDAQGSYVIYNFPDATETITLGGNAQISGTIFAPKANVIKENNGNINGQVIAKSFVHNRDEIHFWPFLPSVAEPVADKITLTATSKCIKNAPWLEYNVTPNYDTQGKTAKIEWINSEGTIVHEDNNQPLNGSILFPGAQINPDGEGMAWPGYKQNGTSWDAVEDLTSTLKNDGAKIRVTVDPSETIFISYPGSTDGCSTVPPVSPPVTPPLPVTLASFTATNDRCNVKLKWTITEAKNFSHFIVERSADAKSFTSLNRVDYAADSKDYRYTDSPFAGETVPAKYYYYRLQQVDNDGTFEYSTIRSAEAGQCDARLSVDFYPNPTQNEMKVKSFSPVKMLEILTTNGKQVYKVLPTNNETELNVNVKSFAQGLYIVNILNEEGAYSSKILKN